MQGYIRQYAKLFLNYETGNITDFCKSCLDKGIYLKLRKFYSVILTKYDGVLDDKTIKKEKVNNLKAKNFQIKQQKKTNDHNNYNNRCSKLKKTNEINSVSERNVYHNLLLSRGIDLSQTFSFAVQPYLYDIYEKEKLNRLEVQENSNYDDLVTSIVLGLLDEILVPYHLANLVSIKLKVRSDNNIPMNSSVLPNIRRCLTNHFNYLSGSINKNVGERSYLKMKYLYELTDLVYELAVNELNRGSPDFVNIDLLQLAQHGILNKKKEKQEKKSFHNKTQRTSLKRKHDSHQDSDEDQDQEVVQTLEVQILKDLNELEDQDQEVVPLAILEHQDQPEEVVLILEDLDEDSDQEVVPLAILEDQHPEVVLILEDLDEDQDQVVPILEDSDSDQDSDEDQNQDMDEDQNPEVVQEKLRRMRFLQIPIFEINTLETILHGPNNDEEVNSQLLYFRKLTYHFKK